MDEEELFGALCSQERSLELMMNPQPIVQGDAYLHSDIVHLTECLVVISRCLLYTCSRSGPLRVSRRSCLKLQVFDGETASVSSR